MKKLILASLVFACFLSCKEKKGTDELIYVNGTYKAVQAEYSHGWKAFLEVSIQEDELEAITFDYLDSTGNKKSETTSATYPMDPHPSVWLPQYETALLNSDIDEFSDIDAITGATHSGDNANELMKAVLAAAKEGDSSEQIVTSEE